MTNEEKAAILLLLLDEEIASQVMKNLSKAEIRRIGKHMGHITSISAKEAQAVAREFCDLIREKGGIFSFGVNQARNIVMKALGPENAGGMLSDMRTEDDPLDESPVFEKLRDIDPKLLVDFTRTEHPQTVALILTQLKPDRAADVLDQLTPETQIEVVRRMANLKSVPKDVIEDVAKTLESEVMTGSAGQKEVGGVRRMAEILKNMRRESENNIINAIDGADPDLAAEIRSDRQSRSFRVTSREIRFRQDRSRCDVERRERAQQSGRFEWLFACDQSPCLPSGWPDEVGIETAGVLVDLHRVPRLEGETLSCPVEQLGAGRALGRGAKGDRRVSSFVE